MKSKRILLTGGAGFIGSHMVDKLITLNHDVTVIDNLATGVKSYVNKKATFIFGDITDEKIIKKIFKKQFDIVFHIAGCASTIGSFTNAKHDLMTNFYGTVNIVNAALETKVPRFLYASSMTTYGKVDQLPVSENYPCRPISYYGISKYAAERFVHATGERVDLDLPFNATSFRMFNVYGPRQSLTNPYQGAMAIFIGNVLRNEPIKIFGDGKQSRDFVYIDDVVNAWIGTLENEKTYGKVFNIGRGEDISINKLTEIIIKTTKKNVDTYPRKNFPQMPGDQRHMKANISNIIKTTGWKPLFNLKKGLARTIEWAQQET